MTTARIRRIARRLALYVLVALLLTFFLFPVYWLIVSSFKSPVRLLQVEYWPSFSLFNYIVIAADPRFKRALYTSIGVTLGTLALTLLFGSMAAYAIGRLRFRGRRPLRTLLVWTAAFPPFVLLGGLYALLVNP
ncbi:MAG TPA: hypothetical protein VGD69_04145, partial [Herpetosiphonaceae bacterium]